MTSSASLSLRPGDRPGWASASGPPALSPDTTNINVADARGNLFSASPSSGWFFGGVFGTLFGAADVRRERFVVGW